MHGLSHVFLPLSLLHVGQRSQAVHGWLWEHPEHAECQGESQQVSCCPSQLDQVPLKCRSCASWWHTVEGAGKNVFPSYYFLKKYFFGSVWYWICLKMMFRWLILISMQNLTFCSFRNWWVYLNHVTFKSLIFTAVERIYWSEESALFFPDFSVPDSARLGILSQTESSPQRPEASKSTYQWQRRTQTGWLW